MALAARSGQNDAGMMGRASSASEPQNGAVLCAAGRSGRRQSARRAHLRSLPLLGGPLSVLLLLLSACGSGGSGPPGAAAAGSDPAGLLATSTAIIVADVDGDGQADVLQVPFGDVLHPSDEPVDCWRGGVEGDLARRDDWSKREEVESIREDLEHQTDAEILGDEGAHCVSGWSGLSGWSAGDARRPYAVLHLRSPQAGDPEQAPVTAPIVHCLRPDSGRPGGVLAITGTDLTAPDAETRVTFDDLSAEVIVALPRFLLVLIPEQAPLGLVHVVVTRGDADSAQTSEPVSFRVREAARPVLKTVRPSVLVPGILAVLSGTHLGTPLDRVVVEFGGVAATEVLPMLAHVLVRIPVGAVSGEVVVTVNGVASNGLDVTVSSDLPAPTITALTPAAASPGSLVRIEGEHLFLIGARPLVHFGTAPAVIFHREHGALLAIVPAEANGPVTVEVAEHRSTGAAFDRLDRGPPTIESLDPTSGSPGEVVDIVGTDLYDLSGFSFFRPLPLPKVTFAGRRAFFVFPTIAGLHTIVPFHATTGDLIVDLDDTQSNAVPFVLK